MKKIDLGVVVTTLIIVTISCSLAFFAARVIGNPKDINLVAKNVAITFTDTSSIASDVISPGWNNVKTFTITNNSKEDFIYNITLKGLVNTFESINTLQYKITSDTGYNMDNYLNVIKTETSKDVVLAYNITIPKNTIQSYQVEFNYVSTEEDQSGDMGKKLGGTLAIEASTGTPEIYDKLLADNPTIKTRTDFSTIFNETNVNTLYKAAEDNTDVYYFAGDARNNWVKFGEWQEDKTVILGNFENSDGVYTASAKEFSSLAECNSYMMTSIGINYETTNCRTVKIASKGDPMYWRIIRTNADGSIRLLYAGTNPNTDLGYIGTSAFNDIYTADPLYLGYMYGTSGSLESNRTNENSNLIKTYIDTWYKNNLSDYTKYLSKDAVYCNDRNVATIGDYTSYKIGGWMNLAIVDRASHTFSPTYNCANTKDAFSVNNSEAKLTYPVALMTADEAMYAGGVFLKESTNLWFYSNSKNESILGELLSWLMTPVNGSPNYSGNIMAIRANGKLYYPDATNTNQLAVRPVISIKGDLIYKSGDGSAEAPYEIEDFTSLKDKVLSDNPTIETRTDFTSVYTETNTGKIFKSTETNTPVYYFAGNAQNNWVKFGTWQGNKTIILGKTSNKKAYKLFSSISLCNADPTYNTDCKEITLGKKGENMYWRIIRTNSDGSVRMLYAGTSVTGTDQAFIDFSVFNESNGVEDTKYNGYMYGTSGSQANNRINENSSDIKKVIDNWYKTNLNSYTKYLSTTAVYCNDRSIVSNSGADRTHFAGNLRVSGISVDGNWTENQKVNPSYDCNTDVEGKKLSDASVSDLFSVSNISGNGKLTYPIALMTADEVVYAGGFPYKGANAYYAMNAENKFILNKIRWWLMTPSSTYGNSSLFDIINTDAVDNYLNNDNGSENLYSVRPVISIKENAIYKSGDGSAESPYEIVTK